MCIIMPSFSDCAVVLKRFNFGEADRILTFFTRNHGKVTVIAKGIRRPISKKAGHLELFNYVNVFIAEGRNLGIVCEAEVIDSFENIKKNLRKVGQAFYITELVDVLLPEDQKNYKVFELLLSIFSKINSSNQKQLSHESGQASNVLQNFEVELLKILGFWSDEIFSKRLPKSSKSQTHFNRILIEHIIERSLKSPKFLEKLE